MDGLKELLRRSVIYKEENRELYYMVKDSIKDYKDFITEKLGYDLIVRGDFIRLIKTPGSPEAIMGIEEFTDSKEYSMLMLLYIFLEDRGKEEQFLLSHVAEFLSSNDIGETYDWTDYSTRKMLIRVLKYAEKINLIKINDGSEEGFVNDSSKEVLFESTGISRYMARNFPQDIMPLELKDIILEEGFKDINNDKGVLRRNRTYRRLLLSPVVYRGDIPEDYDYIKNFRGNIEDDFEKYLGWKLQVHKNGALLVPQEGERGFNTYPSNGTLSDIILLLSKEIRIKVEAGELKVNEEDIIVINKEEFEGIILAVKDMKNKGFSKEYREMHPGKFIYQVLKELSDLSMIREEGDVVRILPLCGKVIGDYPEDFYRGEVDEG
ncbi:MAG: TIGR02678 family protein [Clostridiaceae bacterium]